MPVNTMSPQAQRDMLRIWMRSDFFGQSVADRLASVMTAIPHRHTAGRMALIAWDGGADEIDPLWAALFSAPRDPENTPEEDVALISAAAEWLDDAGAERVLTALGGLPVSAILASRQLAAEILRET